MRCFGVNFVFVFACFLASWCWRCWLLTILSLYHFSTSGVETFLGTSIYRNFRWIWHCFHPCLWFLKVAVSARPLLMPWLDWFHCAWCLLTFAGRSAWHLSLSQHCLSIASDATSCWSWSFTSKLGSNPKKIQGRGHSWTITVVCVSVQVIHDQQVLLLSHPWQPHAVPVFAVFELKHSSAAQASQQIPTYCHRTDTTPPASASCSGWSPCPGDGMERVAAGSRKVVKGCCFRIFGSSRLYIRQMAEGPVLWRICLKSKQSQ